MLGEYPDIGLPPCSQSTPQDWKREALRNDEQPALAGRIADETRRLSNLSRLSASRCASVSHLAACGIRARRCSSHGSRQEGRESPVWHTASHVRASIDASKTSFRPWPASHHGQSHCEGLFSLREYMASRLIVGSKTRENVTGSRGSRVRVSAPHFGRS